jgi:hypothetical protein
MVRLIVLLLLLLGSSKGFTQEEEPKPKNEAEDAFLKKIEGRWRSKCTKDEGGKSSHFFGIEFKEKTWLTLIFLYPGNSKCLGPASPNDGKPRTYQLKLQAQNDGLFFMTGPCVAPDNNCVGINSIRLKHDGGVLTVFKYAGKSLWFPEGKKELIYPEGPENAADILP